MLGRTDSRLRLIALALAFGLMATLLGVRLAYWQLGEGPDLRLVAEGQAAEPTTADIRRGDITDRSGNVLATTAYRDLLAAYPELMTADERDEYAELLSAILELDGPEATSLGDSFDGGAPYLVVERRLTEQQSEQVRAALDGGRLDHLLLEPHPVRFYPSAGGSPGTTLASQLLGFVSEDGVGRYGVEQAGQDVLAGAGGATAGLEDAALPREGGTVALTIDASLQLRLERELYAAWVADRAVRATGLVMDPYTGAILAWASVPGYDANGYAAVANRSPDLFVDPIVSQVYEPGSVLKMYTAAAALESGTVDLTTTVEDGRTLVLGENTVRNFDKKSMGLILFEDAIAHSRNVATGRVALALGDTTEEASAVLYEMWQRLGIGNSTGIELGSELAGLVSDPSRARWQAIDLVNRAFGQGVAVTPLQLATGFAAMANGGKLVRPHLYAANEQAATADIEQVISPALSDQLRDLMIHVIDEGPHYAEETKIPGYVVGGKTGTAQIWDPEAGAWMDRVYNHTFVGFVGAERPEAVILVRIHEAEPQVKKRWGWALELTSNELFRRVALDTISVLDLQPLPGFDPTLDPAASPEPAASATPQSDGSDDVRAQRSRQRGSGRR
jgi:cell division protein FtsI/penicillin-binding protein 2